MTDTHPVIWYAQRQVRKLGKNAREAFAAYESGAASLHVPVPVMIETWFLVRHGKLPVETTWTQWWRQLRNPQMVLEPLQGDDVVSAADLRWRHQDVYDRLIAATALRLGLPLVTADAEITDWGGVPIVW